MSVDAFTTLAQVLNFLVLVLLLKRFLYGPILRAMRAREERIARRQEEAEEGRRQAGQEREAALQVRREVEARRAEMLELAREEAAAHRGELEQRARLEVAETRRRWHRAIEKEKESFLHEIRGRTQAETLAIVRRVLALLAGETLEHRMAEQLLEQLDQLAEPWPPPGPGERVTVRSSCELPAPLRERLLQALARRCGGPLAADLQVDPDLVCGIEVIWPGHRLGWNVRDLLQDVEERLAGGEPFAHPPDEPAPAPA